MGAGVVVPRELVSAWSPDSLFEQDDFIHNMLTLLGEMRAALVVFQAGALLKNPGGVAGGHLERAKSAKIGGVRRRWVVGPVQHFGQS